YLSSDTGVENVIGSTHNDWIRGNSRGNSLQGNYGSDALIGLAGVDDLVDRDGGDILDGGADFDNFHFLCEGGYYNGRDVVIDESPNNELDFANSGLGI